MTEATQRTSDSGVSIWLDDLSRSRIESGSLQDLIANKNVVGVTTNPSIFQKALHEVGPYDPQLKELGKVDVETAVRELTTTDVRNATDIFREVAEKSDFVDGRVSIEVDPRLAHETEATEKQAEELWAKVNRPNAMIKIPATLEGLPAITATLAKGISVNVTLIFSLERYEQVIDAYIEGIAQADANGHDLKHIGSVASFFVSRVDTAVDKLLEANGSDEAKALEGKAAVANACSRSQGRQEAASAVGLHRHQERRLLRLQVRRRARCSVRRQHHAGEDPERSRRSRQWRSVHQGHLRRVPRHHEQARRSGHQHQGCHRQAGS